MNAPTADAIDSIELRKLIESPKAPRLVDVRTPAEFETAHIAGSLNVPLDVLDKHGADIAQRLGKEDDVVLVCRSGQRSTKAQALLRNAGLTGGRVLEDGITAWEGNGFAVDRGAERWELERQVRLVAGSVVLSSVLGSVAAPRLHRGGRRPDRHLRHGYGAVQTAVQPRGNLRRHEGPVAARRLNPP